jgi:REP element-mobilizing transposase RayT
MAWHHRLCGDNLYHHIYAWGNNRNRIFSQVEHYAYYLNLLDNIAKRHQMDIIAYALMEWHIHLFIYDRINSMANFMQRLHRAHACHHNYETDRVGHAFGERYNNIIVQPNNYALCLSRYIHRQAVEAGLVSDPKMYGWTSYQRYIGLKPYEFVKPNIILDQFGADLSSDEKIKQYINYVNGDKADPVDWDLKNYNVVGDGSFCLHIKNINREKRSAKIKPHDIITIICSDLATDRDRLLRPSGREERILRHRAFLHLIDKYGYTCSEVARLFKVTRLTVLKAVTNHCNGNL